MLFFVNVPILFNALHHTYHLAWEFYTRQVNTNMQKVGVGPLAERCIEEGIWDWVQCLCAGSGPDYPTLNLNSPVTKPWRVPIQKTPHITTLKIRHRQIMGALVFWGAVLLASSGSQLNVRLACGKLLRKQHPSPQEVPPWVTGEEKVRGWEQGQERLKESQK